VTVYEPQLELIHRACRHIEEHEEGPLTLSALAHEVGLSPYHLQRTFKRVMGISPRQYADAVRLRKLKRLLKSGEPVTGAMYDAGYGSSSRLYEHAPSRLGMTPAGYRKGGAGMNIRYTVADCSLGKLLVAATERGICAVRIGDSDETLEEGLRREYFAASIERDAEAFGPWVRTLLEHLNGHVPHLDLPLDIRATAFQWKVWEALRAIPYGSTRSYAEVARAIGQPTATRAVAQACAGNPTALVIPCHRVIREDGSPGGYRWGVERKQALLRHEACATSDS
jgi:AraC family transcriptional regulator of adaptative response/methylated-DNA-[protein]-cysteine methyltransferase